MKNDELIKNLKKIIASQANEYVHFLRVLKDDGEWGGIAATSKFLEIKDSEFHILRKNALESMKRLLEYANARAKESPNYRSRDKPIGI